MLDEFQTRFLNGDRKKIREFFFLLIHELYIPNTLKGCEKKEQDARIYIIQIFRINHALEISHYKLSTIVLNCIIFYIYKKIHEDAFRFFKVKKSERENKSISKSVALRKKLHRKRFFFLFTYESNLEVK